jgi:hypothetical protein
MRMRLELLVALLAGMMALAAATEVSERHAEAG